MNKIEFTLRKKCGIYSIINVVIIKNILDLVKIYTIDCMSIIII